MMEKYIKNVPYNNDYFLEHDKYLFEIDANLYGIIKAKEYLKNNYLELYNKNKDQIEIIERIYKYDYMMYDASNTVDRFIKLLRLTNNFEQLANIKIPQLKNFNDISELDVFLNKDITFKKVEEIINNEKFNKFDKRIIYAIFSSQTFLESIDFSNISLEALTIVKKSLEYTNNIYKNQEYINNSLKNDPEISTLAYIKSKRSFIIKSALLGYYYAISLPKLFNLTRSKGKQKEHVYSVNKYLQGTEEIINNKRKKGYLMLYPFYILEILILTIIFVIFNFLLYIK